MNHKIISVSPHESPRVPKIESSTSIHSGINKIPDAVTLSAVTNVCNCNQLKEASTGGISGGGSNGSGVISGMPTGVGGVASVPVGMVRSRSTTGHDADAEKYQTNAAYETGGDGSQERCPKVNEIKYENYKKIYCSIFKMIFIILQCIK